MTVNCENALVCSLNHLANQGLQFSTYSYFSSEANQQWSPWLLGGSFALKAGSFAAYNPSHNSTQLSPMTSTFAPGLIGVLGAMGSKLMSSRGINEKVSKILPPIALFVIMFAKDFLGDYNPYANSKSIVCPNKPDLSISEPKHSNHTNEHNITCYRPRRYLFCGFPINGSDPNQFQKYNISSNEDLKGPALIFADTLEIIFGGTGSVLYHVVEAIALPLLVNIHIILSEKNPWPSPEDQLRGRMSISFNEQQSLKIAIPLYALSQMALTQGLTHSWKLFRSVSYAFHQGPLSYAPYITALALSYLMKGLVNLIQRSLKNRVIVDLQESEAIKITLNMLPTFFMWMYLVAFSSYCYGKD